MNKGKVGRPYQITNSYARFLALIRSMLNMPYRQLEGFTLALNRLIPQLRPVDYSEIRKRLMKLDYNIEIKKDANDNDNDEPLLIS